MKTVRLGCVGTGGIAKRHLNAFADMKDVEIVAVSSSSADRANDFASSYGARGFDSYARMLQDVDLDALVITVIPSAHGDVERAAIAAGVPMLIEKPLAVDWNTAEQLHAEMLRVGVGAAVGYQWRYNTALDEVREAIGNRPIGLVSGLWVGKTPPPPWWSLRKQSGGQMQEQATHVVDLARLLVGEIEQVQALAGQVSEGRTPEMVDDVEAAVVRFRSGAIGSFGTTHLAPTFNQEVSLRIFCEGLAVTIDREGAQIDDGTQPRVIKSEGDSLQRQDRAFIDAVKAGDVHGMRSPYADALLTHEVTTSMSKAAGLGAPVVLRGAQRG